MMCDWKAQILEFNWAGTKVVLNGLRHKEITTPHSEEISREAKGGQVCFALTIQTTHDVVSSIPEEIHRLLQQFEDVFQVPTELPPNREIEHHITIKEGADPVNVRPYRYAHFQKEEIEKQVMEMLASGLIQPSSSLFSSPVLSVNALDVAFHHSFASSSKWYEAKSTHCSIGISW